MSYKLISRITGILFIVATISFMVGNGLVESAVGETLDSNRLILGIMIQVINSVAVVAIAIMLYPIINRMNTFAANGYIAFRVMEAVVLVVGMIGPLMIISADVSLHELLMKSSFYSYQLAMLLLGVFSVYLCYVLYKKSMVPRAISILGIAGYIALCISVFVELMGLKYGMYFYIPGGLFELIFPIWLIVKGFEEEKNSQVQLAL